MRIFGFLFLLFLGLAQANAADLLEPEQAFRFSAQQADANHLEVRYQIADGYYMYRERFKFSLDGGTLGTPQFPAGKMHADPTFGQVETYRNEVRVKLPFTRTGNAQSVKLKAVSQGCADAGVIKREMTIFANANKGYINWRGGNCCACIRAHFSRIRFASEQMISGDAGRVDETFEQILAKTCGMREWHSDVFIKVEHLNFCPVKVREFRECRKKFKL